MLPALEGHPEGGGAALFGAVMPEAGISLGQPCRCEARILGFVAKGSFGTILKVLDCGREKVCAVKVVPKVEVLRRDTLKQCKEEVSIQRQVRHPFVHGLGDSWQGQRHLFIMCTYCSTGDLHALWRAAERFAEATVRLFAAELVLVLVYLHDLGIVHRDVKMENILLDERGHLKLTDFGLSRHLRWGERAHTICGTLQYMAPEVLSGGPYSHTADWWSLGVLLFALASGEFPVAPAGDHVAMLERVKQSSYESPPAFSPALARLLAELLCHNPLRRLRYLHHFQGHPFFHGVVFDADLLQKDPVAGAVAPRPPEQPPPDPAAFADFDCDLAAPPVSCTRRPPSSVAPVPCNPGPPQSAALRPPSSTPLVPCPPEPPSSTIPETPRTPTLGSSTSEPPRSPTLVPGAPEPLSSTSLESPGSSTPGSCTSGSPNSTPEPPSSIQPVLGPSTPASLGSTEPAPLCSLVLGPSTPELPSGIKLSPLCSPALGPSTPEPPSSTEPVLGPSTPEPYSSTELAPLCSPVLGPSTPEPPSSVLPAPLCSPVLVLCTPEPPSGSTTPGPPDIISSVPCTPNSLGSTTLAPCTPGLPGTSSTPREAPFHGWRAVPADVSCSPVAPEPPAGDGIAGPLPCQDTPEGAESPAPAPLEQGPPPTEAGRSEHAGSDATAIPSPEVVLGAESWVLPLAWLEKSLNTLSVLESLQHSLPLPAPQRVAGTSVTPVPTAVAGTSVTPVPTAVASTFMTPQYLQERSMNTSVGGPPCTKHSAAETDSLLWHCPQEHLKSLPRAELEGWLESILIVNQVLSLQLRSWQESQQPLPGVGPAEQRDAVTQTDIAHLKGSAWSRQCLLFRGHAGAVFQSLQDKQGEQVRALVLRCQAVLESVPGKLQSCLEERDAMRQRVDEALRAKEEADGFLESFRAHASAQISARDQSLASQRELGTLLVEAIDQQASLAAETQHSREFIDITFEKLEEERKALDTEWEQARALMSRCQAALESVPGKLQSSLEERDAMRQRAEEALQAKEEASCQLEETSVALQDAAAQLEQLTVANSRLSADLSSLMMNLASLEQERDALQQENKEQWEEMARLSRERSTLQQECNGLYQELREATECREFLNQENHVSRTQLLEVEAKLKSSQAALQECSMQYEDLMDSHQRLREEQAALGKELESTKAELLDLRLKRDKISWCSTDIAESKMWLRELADCLRAALQAEDDAPLTSRAWTPGWQTPHRAWTPVCRMPSCRTPYRAGASFVGSVLKAVSGKEPEDGLLESMKELRAVVSDLAMLSSRIQDLEQSKFKALQTELSDLQLQLETVTAQSQEKMDTQAATIAKLNKMLRGKIENEKLLQDVVKQQEEKMLQLIDKSGEVTMLKEEVSLLKRSLQRAETEAKVLWEEVRGQESKVDADYVQERVLLQREVDKLRLLLVEREDERLLLSNKYLEQVRGLELRLHHTQKVLRTHEEMQEKVKEVLSAFPDAAAGCHEFHSLLRYLGLKPASGSKEAAEPSVKPSCP
ncbi:PREDICTED: sperm-associated antigen 5-like [Nipponia nippon]|nr:PREDICTED: sperm-associated antigen 5-like [Nipponia nippon]